MKNALALEKLKLEKVEEEFRRVEAEKKLLEFRLEQANAELLRLKGLFSVLGMLEYIEEKNEDLFLYAVRNIKYSRRELYIYMAKNHTGLTDFDPQKFGSLMAMAYQNYSEEIHDGKRSPTEVSEAGDSIVIRESLLVNYDQVQCIKSFAKYFKYPYQIKLLSKS
ncbi:hypothetical protein HDV02_001889 [Globomyces sp. JEL0801]|nr:hypothetical protein HDV02_001889 [Globomyces sp. JEL0801]